MKFLALSFSIFALLHLAPAYDPLDPNGNITVKWDVMFWKNDGYIAIAMIKNFQMYCHIAIPGSWDKKEVIWNIIGAQTADQGDCFKFKDSIIPHCCKKDPTVVDFLPGVPYNQQFANCCKGGAVAAWGQDPSASILAFQVSEGLASTSNKTIKLPKNFTLLGPGPGYTCGPAKVAPSSMFLATDLRHKTQALMTLNVTCTFSQFLVRKNPNCYVSFSSFYNDTIPRCPNCV